MPLSPRIGATTSNCGLNSLFSKKMKCEKVCSFSVLKTMLSAVKLRPDNSMAYSSLYCSGTRVESFWHISRLVSVEKDISVIE